MQLIKPIRTVMISLLMVLNSQQLYAREISMLTVEWAPHYGSELPENSRRPATVPMSISSPGHGP
jgi:hypothetical protein